MSVSHYLNLFSKKMIFRVYVIPVTRNRTTNGVDFRKLIEITASEDKKTLLQLVINNTEGGSSHDGGSPSFLVFTIRI
jgi:hypothetical protein